MKTVAVFFGGQSTEHDVSIVTALGAVIKPLEASGDYKVEAVYIAKDGRWFWDDALKNITLYQGSDIEAFMQKEAKAMLQFDQGLVLAKSGKFGARLSTRRIDVAFPAMHGTHGEDGELMGVFEMAGVPYVGCGVTASAIAMDKVLTKQIITSYTIPTNRWVWCMAKDVADSPQEVLDRIQPLAYPLFVKPAHGGSSIGISRVNERSQLVNALEVAAHFDDKIIIEEAVPNVVEVTLPVMGNKEPVPAYLEQPLTKDSEFFDFNVKYMQGGKGGAKSGKRGAQGYSNIPAKVSDDLYAAAEKIGLDAYKALGCEGLARIDMLIDSKAKKVYFNEVNPMPGDLYAHNWLQKGYSKVELVTTLITLAEERAAERALQHTSFVTNYLKQF